ncbi:MAG: TlpA family protein disulfide reductase [Actinomycetota bacterium]
MRRPIFGVIAAALVLVACGGDEPASLPEQPGVPTDGQSLFPVVASSEIVVGDNRLQIGLIDDNDAPLRSPETELHVSFVAPGRDQPSSETDMSFLWTIKPIQGLWAGEATFDAAGQWEAIIDVSGGGYDETVTTTVDVRKDGTTPVIGEPAPSVDTPTAADVADLSEISTDSNPDPRLYKLSIADALKSGKPTVIVFATPKFCTSQVCGPTLSIVKDVAKEFPKVNFIHIEPYDLDKVPEKLEPVPAVTAWGLPSEPWVFVTDGKGRVAAKYEGSVAPSELTALLRSP